MRLIKRSYVPETAARCQGPKFWKVCFIVTNICKIHLGMEKKKRFVKKKTYKNADFLYKFGDRRCGPVASCVELRVRR